MDKSIYFLFVFEPFPYTDRGFLLALSSINSQLWFKAQFRIRKTTIAVLLQYFVIFCQIFFYANSKLRIRKTTIVEFFEDLMCKSNPKAISPKYKTYYFQKIILNFFLISFTCSGMTRFLFTILSLTDLVPTRTL